MANRTISDFAPTSDHNPIASLRGAQVASMIFEPWEAPREGDRVPPTKDEWIAMADTHAVHLRTAWKMMEHGKAYLMAMAESLGGEVTLDMLDSFDSTARFLEGTAMIVRSAATRMSIAAAATLGDDASSSVSELPTTIDALETFIIAGTEGETSAATTEG